MVTKEAYFSAQLRALVSSSVLVFSGLIISKLIAYGYRFVVAREFGPEIYGMYTLGLAVVGWFAALLSLGLSDGLLRFISYYRGKKDTRTARYLFNRVWKILLVTSIIGGALLFCTASFIATHFFSNPSFTLFLQIMSLAIPFSILAGPYLSLLLSFEKIAWHSLTVNILQNGALIIALLSLSVSPLFFLAVPSSYFLSILTLFISSYLIARFALPRFFLTPPRALFSKDPFTELVAYSLPRLFLGIVSFLFFWIDSLILGAYHGIESVGFYNVAAPLAIMLGFFPELFMRLFIPLVTKEYSRGNLSLIKGLSGHISKWILIVNLPLFFVLAIFPGAAITLFFGATYLPALDALRFLSFGGLIYSLSITPMNLLSARGASKTVLFVFVSALIANMGFNFLLIPSYGLIGAAIATAGAYVILGALFYYYACKSYSFSLLPNHLFAVGSAGGLSALLLVLLTSLFSPTTFTGILFTLGIYILVYLGLLFVFPCFDAEDKDIFTRIMQRVKRLYPC